MKSRVINLRRLIFRFRFENLRWVLPCAVLFFNFAASDHAQQNPLGAVNDLHATDFVSNQYYESPNEQKVKMRLSGAAALPLPNGGQDIRDLKIETFDVNGKTNAILHAPQCNYAFLDGVANSPGHLELKSGDGKINIEGEGFLWRQNDNSLTISNNVYTVIKAKTWKMTSP